MRLLRSFSVALHSMRDYRGRLNCAMRRGAWMGWIGRIGVVTVAAMFLTTGCGLLFSTTAHKPPSYSATASSSHAGGSTGHGGGGTRGLTAGRGGHGGGGLPAGRGGQRGTKALAAGRVDGKGAGHSQPSTVRSQTQPAEGGNGGGSASSVASAVQSLFGQIGAPQTAKTHTARSGTGTTGAAAGVGSAPDGATGASSSLGDASGSPSSSHGGSSLTGAGGKAAMPSEADIVQPYVAQLQSLRSQYLGLLSSLYNQARTDYQQGKGSKLAIEAKSLPQLVSLENSAQDQVNDVLFALRDQLQAHGYPTAEMNTLRSDFYSQVQQEIAALRG